MSKTVLITGATDGIGLLAAKTLAARKSAGRGHRLLLHGRDAARLEAAQAAMGVPVETCLADLSDLAEVEAMAESVLARHSRLDVLINNAGVLKAARTVTPEGLDIRFVVNTFAPWLLTRRLSPIMPETGRIVNLSSAAQARIDPRAMAGESKLGDMEAYSQSKLGITIWSRELAREFPAGPAVVAVNPGSLLASKMVREGFGIEGKDPQIGADILCRAALDPEFADASGKYFDNDSGRFAEPHRAASDADHVRAFMEEMERIVGANRRDGG